MDGDKIADPRDRPWQDDAFLSDQHPGSLAAFEVWCRQIGASAAIKFIAQYRRAINNHRKQP
jgi:hypothetical protein